MTKVFIAINTAHVRFVSSTNNCRSWLLLTDDDEPSICRRWRHLETEMPAAQPPDTLQLRRHRSGVSKREDEYRASVVMPTPFVLLIVHQLMINSKTDEMLPPSISYKISIYIGKSVKSISSMNVRNEKEIKVINARIDIYNQTNHHFFCCCCCGNGGHSSSFIAFFDDCWCTIGGAPAAAAAIAPESPPVVAIFDMPPPPRVDDRCLLPPRSSSWPCWNRNKVVR